MPPLLLVLATVFGVLLLKGVIQGVSDDPNPDGNRRTLLDPGDGTNRDPNPIRSPIANLSNLELTRRFYSDALVRDGCIFSPIEIAGATPGQIYDNYFIRFQSCNSRGTLLRRPGTNPDDNLELTRQVYSDALVRDGCFFSPTKIGGFTRNEIYNNYVTRFRSCTSR